MEGIAFAYYLLSSPAELPRERWNPKDQAYLHTCKCWEALSCQALSSVGKRLRACLIQRLNVAFRNNPPLPPQKKSITAVRQLSTSFPRTTVFWTLILGTCLFRRCVSSPDLSRRTADDSHSTALS